MNESAILSKSINNKIAAGTIFVIGLSGMILNFTGVILTFRVRALRTSFGRLTAVHCSADCAILAIFTFWCSSRTFFEYADHDSLMSRKMGQLSLFFWFITLYSQLFIALNRFSLIFFPRVYHKLFQDRTSKLIIFYVSFCIGHFCVYFGDGCDFYYNADTYFWELPKHPADNLLLSGLILSSDSICAVVLLLDVICVFNMRKNATMLAEALNHQDKKTRSQREMRFLVQACCTGLLFTMMLISFHIISRHVSGVWSTFLTTSLVWELSHLGDGIILFMFNNELKRALLQPKLLFSLSTIKDTTQGTRIASISHHSTQVKDDPSKRHK